MTFANWFSEILFDGAGGDERPWLGGDRDLMPNVRTKLEFLGMPTPGGRMPVDNPGDLDLIDRFERLRRAVDDGTLPALAERLRGLEWPEGVRPPDGFLAEQSVDAIVRLASQLLKRIAGMHHTTQAEKDNAAQALVELIDRLAGAQGPLRTLVDNCRAREMEEWIVGLQSALETLSRFRAIEPRPPADPADPALEVEPVLEATLALLHLAGAQMLANDGINMGMSPLEIFCACYMTGETEAVRAYPRFPAWRDATVACIEHLCEDRPEHQWMCEANTVRNLVRVACWGMMFEHGRSTPALRRYYKRWLHAALRDEARLHPKVAGQDRFDYDQWLEGLYTDWMRLHADIRDQLKPPAPFEVAWGRLEKSIRGEPGHREDDAPLLDHWPMNVELRIDELAKQRREARVLPTHTGSRWFVTAPLPADWMAGLHTLARFIRIPYQARWTVALVSKLGYFAVLPPDDRDEPREGTAIALRQELDRRVRRMGDERELSPDVDPVAALCRWVEEAVDVHANGDTYRSKPQGQAPGWWMYGRRYATFVLKHAEEHGLCQDAVTFARALYCEAVWHGYKPAQTASRMVQYLARLSVDDKDFAEIWNTWVPAQPVAVPAARHGA